MANKEHIELLDRGVEVWNKWRAENIEFRPDLAGTDWYLADLRGANLSGSNLNDARFIGTDLSHANLKLADLNGAKLNGANLDNANLSGAIFYGASLRNASIKEADLSRANLRDVDLRDSDLSGSNFNNVRIGWTIFSNIDLSVVEGLETIRHDAPSIISIETIYKSKGNIPQAFLRGIGVPDNFITYMASLTEKAFEFYSCFISYSSKDQRFAEQLHTDLQARGVRCWFAPEDLEIGARIRVGIDESIRKHDKLLLILSKYSVNSEWVEKEVETAFERERREKRLVLFPIRLDDTVMRVENGWPADVRRTRNIGDFKKWKNHDAYEKGIDRLLRDLKAEDANKSSA